MVPLCAEMWKRAGWVDKRVKGSYFMYKMPFEWLGGDVSRVQGRDLGWKYIWESSEHKLY